MGRIQKRTGLLASVLAVALTGAACGGGGTLSADEPGPDKVLVDGAQLTSEDFVSADPAMVITVAESQVATALYDGLTDYDYSDRDNPVITPLVAEGWEHNDTFDEWVFTIEEGQTFSNGDPVLPSSFKYGWERAGSPELASPYGYLIEYLEGGYDYLEGEGALDSVVADDEAMTLTVSTEGPFVELPGLVSLPFFSPLPQGVVESTEDPAAWGQTEMVGNGPFRLDGEPTDSEVLLVPNDTWSGNVYGDSAPALDRIRFVVSSDTDSAFAAFEAGETDSATIPSGRFQDATQKYQNTVDTALLETEYYSFGWNDPILGGAENAKLRQAISVAIDREEIIQKIYGGTRVMPTGLAPEGVPGFTEGICEYCDYDPDRAGELLEQWKNEGGTLDGPITIDFNSDGGHEDVVALMAEDLAAIGIEVEFNAGGDDYFGDMADGGCHLCRSGWIADYPSYASFTYDLLHSSSIGGNNLGSVDSPELDELLDAAADETDPIARGEKFVEAERFAVNDLAAVLVVNWVGGNKVFSDRVENYDPTPLGFIEWERVDIG